MKVSLLFLEVKFPPGAYYTGSFRNYHLSMLYRVSGQNRCLGFVQKQIVNNSTKKILEGTMIK